MKYDKCGFAYSTLDDLCELLYQNPNADISQIYVEDPKVFNDAVDELYPSFEKLKSYDAIDLDIDEMDSILKENWFLPDEYNKMDIAQWILSQCKTQDELQRVGEELLLYQERNLLPLLRQLKYIVDTWRREGVVWGVGRGSSVASYVLYLIGVHRINSMYYDLSIEEFLR